MRTSNVRSVVFRILLNPMCDRCGWIVKAAKRRCG